ncbi:hypothetical protein AJ79_04404 [Helicocarpus griseus UAMH5409]|uniref:Uncharacterized protein n=1 Tax=Helicocarpus griseus UAMH5409 TaxID=1447875 RepID=A0A2B7XKF1_9EURO|nr:hypothetical protein AJ79_04404 [Helicocarpus griseus UAMH5409]
MIRNPYPDGETRLQRAIGKGQNKLASRLIQHGALEAPLEDKGKATLARAAKSNNLGFASLLVDICGDIVNSISNGASCGPIHYAIEREHAVMVKLLLEKGGDVNFKNRNGCTALCMAVENGFNDILPFLIEMDADPNNQCGKANNIFTPLRKAVYKGNSQVVRLLLEAGARLERYGFILTEAIDTSYLDIVEALLDHRPNGSDMSRWPRSLIYRAASRSDNASILRLLAQRGVDLNKKDNRGRTILHEVASRGSESVARNLLSAGADAEILDGEGDTPLHIAWKENSRTMVRILMEHGVDLEAKDVFGNGKAIYEMNNTSGWKRRVIAEIFGDHTDGHTG